MKNEIINSEKIDTAIDTVMTSIHFNDNKDLESEVKHFF